MKTAIILALIVFYVLGIGGSFLNRGRGIITTKTLVKFLTAQFTVLAGLFYLLLG